MFNRALLEVMTEGDASGRVFTFPIPTYNITKDFDWDNANIVSLWESAAKYGIPYFSNFVEIDPSGQVDAYGIPILKVHMAWGENERAMVPDMAESAAEMMDAAGAVNIQPFAVPDRVPGYGIHETGVARMGKDPRTSVLDQYQRAHDVPNLFVMDGAGFTSGGCQNPTLTIMALAVRSSDHLLAEMKAGRL